LSRLVEAREGGPAKAEEEPPMTAVPRQFPDSARIAPGLLAAEPTGI
jgi:hypothetical protein